MEASVLSGSSRRALLFFAVFLNSFCFCQSAASSEEETIREAMVRYQMQGWIEGGRQSEKRAKTAAEKAVAREMNFKVFFVSINGKDPTNAFINRLRDLPRVIKKVSSSRADKEFDVVDKATGQRGIIFRANQIRWLNKESVELDGGYVCGGRCGIWATYKLNRNNGKWAVAAEMVHRIS